MAYKIFFYRNRKRATPCIYYREFNTPKDLKEWAMDILNNDSLYCHFRYIEITTTEYLHNI